MQQEKQWVEIGDIVLVRLDAHVQRPLIVTFYGQVPVADLHADGHRESLEWRLSGTICCEPEDHTRPALRGILDRSGDPARFHGRPERHLPLAYGELLRFGPGPGEWMRVPKGDR